MGLLKNFMIEPYRELHLALCNTWSTTVGRKLVEKKLETLIADVGGSLSGNENVNVTFTTSLYGLFAHTQLSCGHHSLHVRSRTWHVNIFSSLLRPCSTHASDSTQWYHFHLRQLLQILPASSPWNTARPHKTPTFRPPSWTQQANLHRARNCHTTH